MNRFLAVAVAIVALPVVGFVVFNDHLPCKFSIRACRQNPNPEGKSYSNSANKAQKPHYLEHQRFGNSIEEIGIGIPTRTEQHEFSIRTTPTSAFFHAVPIGKNYLSKPGYVGAVFLNKDAKKKDASEEDLFLDIICEAKGREATLAMKPVLKNGSPVCPEGSTQLKNY